MSDSKDSGFLNTELFTGVLNVYAKKMSRYLSHTSNGTEKSCHHIKKYVKQECLYLRVSFCRTELGQETAHITVSGILWAHMKKEWKKCF